MPTTPVHTFDNQSFLLPLFPGRIGPRINVKLAPSLTLAKGTILGEMSGGSAGTFKAYASGNTDGSQIPRMILGVDATSDASGNVNWGGEWSATKKHALAVAGGVFKCEDLIGMDANAVTLLNATILEGTLSAGIIDVG